MSGPSTSPELIQLGRDLVEADKKVRKMRNAAFDRWKAANPDKSIDEHTTLEFLPDDPFFFQVDECHSLARMIIEFQDDDDLARIIKAKALRYLEQETAEMPKPDPQKYLNDLKLRWENSENVVCIWMAVFACCQNHQPFPDWCMDYLHRSSFYVAQQIRTVQRNTLFSAAPLPPVVNAETKKSLAGVAKAFGFSKQGKNQFLEFLKDERKISNARFIEFHDLEKIIDHEADRGMSAENMAQMLKYSPKDEDSRKRLIRKLKSDGRRLRGKGGG